ncbi:hypothetical protein BpHYR1_036454 [Brachionus plicatilis]|uniref:Uncharacterized protein n=1 Tax=Brachionus plicatilis TaxID=10195 RepID=A0A3M7SRE6_BRAPC|nr:hypothetical protein BpHYR1_036454 [Brachionus plicatilis]
MNLTFIINRFCCSLELWHSFISCVIGEKVRLKIIIDIFSINLKINSKKKNHNGPFKKYLSLQECLNEINSGLIEEMTLESYHIPYYINTIARSVSSVKKTNN